MKASVIIPVYMDVKGLSITLRSLEGQTIDPNLFEIIVVNDGNDKRIEEYINKYEALPNITLIYNEINQGAYFSRNSALKICNTNNIVFTDAGCVAASNWLETGLQYLQMYDYVAGDVLIDIATVHSLSEYHDYLTAFPVESYFNQLGFGVTANLFVKKSVFEELGLFSDNLFSGGDMEFGIRCRENKIKAMFAADSMVYHEARNHREKIKKHIRVEKGKKELFQKEPIKYVLFKKTFKHKLKSLLPPSLSMFKHVYKKHESFGPIQFYLYMYWLKLSKALQRI